MKQKKTRTKDTTDTMNGLKKVKDKTKKKDKAKKITITKKPSESEVGLCTKNKKKLLPNERHTLPQFCSLPVLSGFATVTFPLAVSKHECFFQRYKAWRKVFAINCRIVF